MPLLVGLLGLAISLIGIWVPSVWYDEAATITAATRSWPELWAMTGNVDAVHAVYYFVIHALVDIFGYSPVLVRLPSAIAVGVAASLTVVLARKFTSTRVAALGGIVFCLLPRVTWMGTEARSYALSAALAVLMTLLFVRAQRSDGWRPWVAYAIVVVLSSLVFVYLALIVVAHGVSTAWWLIARRTRPHPYHRWPVARRFLVASISAAILLVPFLLAVVGQSGQLHWIDPIGPDTWRQVVQTQWFYYSFEYATAGWALLLFGGAALLRRTRGFSFGTVLLPLVVIPTLVLLLASVLDTPLYTPRYLTMCLPFVALVMAMGIEAIPTRPLRILTLLSLVVLAVPQVTFQRMPEGKQDSSWKEVAAFIADERASAPGLSTAIIYGPVKYHPIATTRVIEYSYPEAFAGTIDVTLDTPAAQTAQLWETEHPLSESVDRLERADVAYLVTSTSRDQRDATTTQMVRAGWTLTESVGFTDVNVLQYRPAGALVDR